MALGGQLSSHCRDKACGHFCFYLQEFIAPKIATNKLQDAYDFGPIQVQNFDGGADRGGDGGANCGVEVSVLWYEEIIFSNMG